jgi:predicted permease
VECHGEEMTRILQDLRHAVRTLRRSPGFTIAAVLSLAIGIGANTAVFSVTYALLIRPLPYANADRLVILWNRSPGLNIGEDWFSTAQYFDIKNGHHGFDALAIAVGANYNMTGQGEPERIGVIRVSSNLLPMLGASPAAGRLFRPEEDQPGQPNVAVLSHGTWQRVYGGDPHIIGRSISLNDVAYEIVGVLPPQFSLPREVLPTLGVVSNGDVLLPLPLPTSAAMTRTREDYNIIGTLRRGVTVDAAQAEMDTITARLRRDFPAIYPPNGALTFSIVALRDQVAGRIRRPLLMLMGAVGCVLLITCANVANLLLSRGLTRRKEIAVRAALGASRRRILSQLLTESVVLGLVGGAAGATLALLAVRVLPAIQPPDLPGLADLGINVPILAFTFGLSVLSAALFGIAPAWGVRRLDVHATLKEAGRGSAGMGSMWGRRPQGRQFLVAAEIALAVTLLIGAGLLVRSFAAIARVPPGFDPRGLLTLELSTNGQKYPNGKAVAMAYHDLLTRLDGIPGVLAAGAVTPLPLSGYFAWGPITVEGRVPPAGEAFINADQRVVAGRYFEAMHIPLVRGRLFTDDDLPDHQRVLIVDRLMAETFWPGEDPIGKRLKTGDAASQSPWETIVGVVGRVKQYGLDSDARIALYRPQAQSAARTMYLAVSGSSDPASLSRSVAQQIHEMDRELPVYHVMTMEARVRASMARQRFLVVLLTAFASVALALAAIGVYGVMAYLVTQGTREIGIRMALGATERAVLALVLGRGLTVGLAGLVVGLFGAFALSRLLHSLLFGASPTDPVTFGGVALLLVLVALAASYVPARRASRTPPMASLQSE